LDGQHRGLRALRLDRLTRLGELDLSLCPTSMAPPWHGLPWTLVEAGVLEGRTITSWPSLQTDIRNAGGTWVDEEVHVDNGLVSSRKPDDLPAFCAKVVEEFCEGRHAQAAA
jgi:hypothetical protein